MPEFVTAVTLQCSGDETLARDALHRGAEDYLLKGTVDRNALLRAIRYAVERHRSVRDLARVKKELGWRSCAATSASPPASDARSWPRGIETARELDIVRGLGIEYGQGYLWGKPA